MAVVNDQLITTLEVVGLGRYTNSLSSAADALGLFDAATTASGRKTLAWGIAAGAGAAAMAAGMVKAVQEAGRLQQMEIGFTTILGSADAAKVKIEELQEFAAKTPFNFAETANLSKQLIGMGVAADDVIGTMRDLGDATAALGLGQDALQRIVLNYGQIRTTGKVTMREMRDFAVNGLPVFQILKDELGLTQEQLGNIGEEGISADRALAAIRSGLSKRFGGAMEAQNKTLAGSFSNLQDSAQRAGGALGKSVLPPVIAITRGVTGAIDAFNAMPEGVKGATGVLASLASVGLAAVAIRAGVAIFQTGLLAKENVELANASLKAGEAAAVEAGAEGATATSMTNAANAATTLSGRLKTLIGSHEAATTAANLNAAAHERLAAAMMASGSGGIVPPRTKAAAPAAVKTATATAGEAAEALVPVAVTAAAAKTVVPVVGPAEAAGAAAAGAVGAKALGTAAKTVVPVVGPAEAAGAAAAGAVGAKALGTAAKGTGAFAKAGTFLKSGPGVGMLALIASELALSAVPDKGDAGGLKHVAQGAVGGAGFGAMAGFINPALALPGAAVGGLIGGGMAAMNELKVESVKARPRDEQLKMLGRIADSLDKLLDEERKNGKEAAFNSRDIPLAAQVAALNNAQWVG